eukprot:Skav233708  [mRNA]  locus=scaffold2120:22102:24105:+ [translate_table: standard]
MPPPSLGKLIASYGEVPGGPWLNADALGVPRGPCRMCKSCPGLPGAGLLYWPQLPDDVEPVVKPPGLGSSRCRRCECPAHQHQNLELWLMDVKRRAKQIRFVKDYDPKELVVVDTGPEPSSFWQEKAQDAATRVIYRHFRVADSRLDLPQGWKKGAPATLTISDQDLWDSLGLQPKAWSLGMKRNVAIELSAGEIIAHFDDDDLYAPGYLTWMYERLDNVLKKSKDAPAPPTSEYVESKLSPAAVTLKAWHLLDLSDMTFGYMDVENDPLVPKDQRYGWLFGWGFSYMFTRSCWELTPVPDVEWSEDISFYEDLKKLKVPVVPVKPPGSSSAICAHSYHAKVNTSGGEFSGAVRCGHALPDIPAELVGLMPLAQAAAGQVPTRLDRSIGEKSGFRVSLSVTQLGPPIA